jgi:hypothetical protein
MPTTVEKLTLQVGKHSQRGGLHHTVNAKAVCLCCAV